MPPGPGNDSKPRYRMPPTLPPHAVPTQRTTVPTPPPAAPPSAHSSRSNRLHLFVAYNQKPHHRLACVQSVARWMAISVLITLIGLLSPLITISAAQDDDQASREQVLEALHLDQVDADYVILVDTSKSMEDGGLYQQAISALRPLLQSLSPRDHVSMLTFDSTPALRYSGNVGSSADSVLKKLPEHAEGTSTDIGAAIAAGLKELERSDARPIGNLLLLTDGEHRPTARSEYPTTTSPKWNELGARGDRLNARSSLNSFALALRPVTDAGLLQRAFKQTSVIALPNDQLVPYFERLRDEVSLLKAKALLEKEASKISISWTGPFDDLSYDQGGAEVTLTVQSATKHLPLRLSDLQISSSGVPIAVSGLPESVELLPGQTQRIPVRLSINRSCGFHLGEQSVTDQGDLRLLATVSSPWSNVMIKDLDLTFTPELDSPSMRTTASGTCGVSLRSIWLIAAGLIAVILIARAIAISRQPRLRGSLVILDAGRAVRDEVQLTGRKQHFGKGSLRQLKGTLRGTVTAVRRRSTLDRRIEYGVRLRARAGDVRAQKVLWPGDTTKIGDVDVSYNE
jgi:Mg-chelatase subunit ChlD